MIDFIIKLEDMLKLSGYPDWEIRYMPDEDGYILKLDDRVIFMRDVGNKPPECKEKENDNAED